MSTLYLVYEWPYYADGAYLVGVFDTEDAANACVVNYQLAEDAWERWDQQQDEDDGIDTSSYFRIETRELNAYQRPARPHEEDGE